MKLSAISLMNLFLRTFNIHSHHLLKQFLCLLVISVLSAFILYNLINGLAISDIQKLKDDAEFFKLKQRIRQLIMKIFYVIYIGSYGELNN